MSAFSENNNCPSRGWLKRATVIVADSEQAIESLARDRSDISNVQFYVVGRDLRAFQVFIDPATGKIGRRVLLVDPESAISSARLAGEEIALTLRELFIEGGHWNALHEFDSPIRNICALRARWPVFICQSMRAFSLKSDDCLLLSVDEFFDKRFGAWLLGTGTPKDYFFINRKRLPGREAADFGRGRLMTVFQSLWSGAPARQSTEKLGVWSIGGGSDPLESKGRYLVRICRRGGGSITRMHRRLFTQKSIGTALLALRGSWIRLKRQCLKESPEGCGALTEDQTRIISKHAELSRFFCRAVVGPSQNLPMPQRTADLFVVSIGVNTQHRDTIRPVLDLLPEGIAIDHIDVSGTAEIGYELVPKKFVRGAWRTNPFFIAKRPTPNLMSGLASAILLGRLTKRMEWRLLQSANCGHLKVPEQVLAPITLSLLTRDIPTLIATARYMELALKKDCRQLLVGCTDSHWLSDTCRIVAMRRGCPVISIQNAYLTKSQRYFAPKGTIVTAMDDWSCRLFIEYFGVDERSVRLVGTPRFDPLPPAAHPKDGKVWSEIKELIPGLPLICFAAQPEAYSYSLSRVIRLIGGINTAQSRVNILLKLHPSQSSHNYILSLRKQINDAKSAHNIVINRTIPINDVLNDADVLVTLYSNVAVEAALRNCPVLIANLDNAQLPVPMDELEIGLVARNEAEFVTILQRMIVDPAARAEARRLGAAYISRNPHYKEGNARGVIADFIVRSLQPSRQSAAE